ncbi:MAG: class I SAM-dependent methyltransferase [Verrucomicrobiota bacterium]
MQYAPPGHFYSPLPGHQDISRRQVEWNEPADVDLNSEAQLHLLGELAHYYPEMPFGDAPAAGARFSFAQRYYCHSDAIYLYSLLRHLKPRRLIEVGSGHSSAAALDTDERFLGGSVQFTFIEPYPDRLKSVLKPAETARCALIEKPVQEVPLDLFDALETNDILLIDSSHVSKVGSDVNHLMFRVLPRLRPGVVIHIHDIFFPFEYPEDWFREGRAWNEAYLVRAFLQNNQAYKIMLFADYAGKRFREFLAERMPLCLKDTGGALWLRKAGK